MYGNELTGLCRPEELMRLFAYATRLGRECGVPIDSAMISDVPGYTWGIDLGHGPGRREVLVDRPELYRPHRLDARRLGRQAVLLDRPVGQGEGALLAALHGLRAVASSRRRRRSRTACWRSSTTCASRDYPYDIVPLRWSGYGDNAVPDESLPDWIKGWNERYAWPRLVMATRARCSASSRSDTATSCRKCGATGRRTGKTGPARPSRETAMNRMSADRLVQADTLWAMLAPERRPAAAFADAWRNVLLYSEHTWGAHCSITKPDDPFTTRQWETKQAFAVDADKQSRKLLADALAALPRPRVRPAGRCAGGRVQHDPMDADRPGRAAGRHGSCRRSGLWTPTERPVPTQRLASGQWVFLARDVPAFGAKRFRLVPGQSKTEGTAKAAGNRLATSLVTRGNGRRRPGPSRSLRRTGVAADLVDAKAPSP